MKERIPLIIKDAFKSTLVAVVSAAAIRLTGVDLGVSLFCTTALSPILFIAGASMERQTEYPESDELPILQDGLNHIRNEQYKPNRLPSALFTAAGLALSPAISMYGGDIIRYIQSLF